MYRQDICLIKVKYWSRGIHYMNKSINNSETTLVTVQSFYERKNEKVTWCIGVVLAMDIKGLHTPHLSFVGLFCCCKWKANIHRILYIGYCFCDNYTFLHIHICIRTLSGAVLPQELVNSNIEQQRSDLNPRQMSNQMQQVLGGVGDFHQLSSKSWLCSVHAEYVSPVNQKLVEGFSFGCTIWVEEPAKLFCC